MYVQDYDETKPDTTKGQESQRDDLSRALREVRARSISHWSPYDRVGVVNADP